MAGRGGRRGRFTGQRSGGRRCFRGGSGRFAGHRGRRRRHLRGGGSLRSRSRRGFLRRLRRGGRRGFRRGLCGHRAAGLRRSSRGGSAIFRGSSVFFPGSRVIAQHSHTAAASLAQKFDLCPRHKGRGIHIGAAVFFCAHDLTVLIHRLIRAGFAANGQVSVSIHLAVKIAGAAFVRHAGFRIAHRILQLLGHHIGIAVVRVFGRLCHLAGLHDFFLYGLRVCLVHHFFLHSHGLLLGQNIAVVLLQGHRVFAGLHILGQCRAGFRIQRSLGGVAAFVRDQHIQLHAAQGRGVNKAHILIAVLGFLCFCHAAGRTGSHLQQGHAFPFRGGVFHGAIHRHADVLLDHADFHAQRHILGCGRGGRCGAGRGLGCRHSLGAHRILRLAGARDCQRGGTSACAHQNSRTKPQRGKRFIQRHGKEAPFPPGRKILCKILFHQVFPPECIPLPHRMQHKRKNRPYVCYYSTHIACSSIFW